MDSETLIDKFIFWNKDNNISKHFYNDIVTGSDLNSKYAVEKNHQGYFLVQKDSATFFSNSGIIYRIDSRWGPKDVQCNKDLFDMSLKKNFLIDQPLEDKIISLNGNQLLYTAVSRPNKELGKEISLEIGDGLVNDTFIKEWIVDTTNIIACLKEITKKNSAGFTSNGIYPSHRVRLENSLYAWKTFMKWTDDYQTMIYKSLEVLKIFQVIALSMNNTSEVEMKNIIEQNLNFAKKNWL